MKLLQITLPPSVELNKVVGVALITLHTLIEVVVVVDDDDDDNEVEYCELNTMTTHSCC